MNKLTHVFEQKGKNILTIYATAGYPNLNDTPNVIKALDQNKVDIIEVGIPYSDPLADGPTIQATSERALANGMKLDILFEQLSTVKEVIKAPILLMGYYNQVMKYGLEKFLLNCQQTGVSGLILPDMPIEIYRTQHQSLFEKYNQKVVFLVTPQTSDERIRAIDEVTNGFIYVVSNSTTTGDQKANFDENFLKKISNFGLKNPFQIGFGISNKNDFNKATSYANGAIIGSAFLRVLEEATDIEQSIKTYIDSIIG